MFNYICIMTQLKCILTGIHIHVNIAVKSTCY